MGRGQAEALTAQGPGLRAGARGVMATYWPIVPGAAVPLMIDTFPTAGGAPDTAQALRQAQLKMIDSAGTEKRAIELSYPNYWAAFALIGDGARARHARARSRAAARSRLTHPESGSAAAA